MIALRSRLRASLCLLAVAAVGVGTAGCASVASVPDDTASTAAGRPSLRASSSSETTVVTIGDSIMAGFGLDPDDAWPELLADETQQPVVNLACSGAGFVVPGDCGVAFSGLIDQAVAAHPAVIIVQSSDNDLDEDRHDINHDTRATVARLHEEIPDARIVGIGTLWNQPWDPPESVDWTSEALRASVTAVGGTFVSIGQPFQGDQYLLQWDGEHPTSAGQRVLADRILTALNEVGVEL